MTKQTAWNWNDRELLRYLGHRGQEIPETVETLIAECKRELEEAAEPKAIWQNIRLPFRSTRSI